MTEVMVNLLHAGFLLDVKWTSGFTVSALHTGICFYRQFLIMTLCQLVSRQGKIIIFVDQADVDILWAGLAMIAVYADAICILWGKPADHCIIPLLIGSLQIFQYIHEILAVSDARQHRKHRRPVQRILDTLGFGECLLERRCFGIEQLAAAKGLHH